MARKIIQFVPELIVIDEPESNPDRITLGGTKGIGITQVDDKGSLLGTASVQVSRSISRQPRDMYNPPNVIDVWELNPSIKPIPKGKKFCSHCAEWVKTDGFSPNKGNRDGLQSWCKICRADHARYMYWQQKNTAALPKVA